MLGKIVILNATVSAVEGLQVNSETIDDGTLQRDIKRIDSKKCLRCRHCNASSVLVESSNQVGL